VVVSGSPARPRAESLPVALRERGKNRGLRRHVWYRDRPHRHVRRCIPPGHPDSGFLGRGAEAKQKEVFGARQAKVDQPRPLTLLPAMPIPSPIGGLNCPATLPVPCGCMLLLGLRTVRRSSGGDGFDSLPCSGCRLGRSTRRRACRAWRRRPGGRPGRRPLSGDVADDAHRRGDYRRRRRRQRRRPLQNPPRLQRRSARRTRLGTRPDRSSAGRGDVPLAISPAASRGSPRGLPGCRRCRPRRRTPPPGRLAGRADAQIGKHPHLERFSLRLRPRRDTSHLMVGVGSGRRTISHPSHRSLPNPRERRCDCLHAYYLAITPRVPQFISSPPIYRMYPVCNFLNAPMPDLGPFFVTSLDQKLT
jgi:hypothetical protein